MPAKLHKRLVIDASVASASGSKDATYPTSRLCRDFLLETRKLKHKVVMTDIIANEWKEHQSRFARTWWVSMRSRGQVHEPGPCSNAVFRDCIDQAANSAPERDAMRKDCHLIEAALVTDRTVVSLDEKVRRLFAAASRVVAELQTFGWINAGREDEQATDWLRKGTRLERRHLLGSQAGGHG